MGEQYAHLTWRERLKMEARLKDGWKPKQIAAELGRHLSTIYQEEKRGHFSPVEPHSGVQIFELSVTPLIQRYSF